MLGAIPRVEDLMRLLPEYLENRQKGMDAGHFAEKLGIPLKDVISFLSEENILVDDQVDLELFRVLTRKNPDSRVFISEQLDISAEVLDSLLLTSDDSITRGIWVNRQRTTFGPLFNGLVFFFLAANLPLHLIMQMASILMTLIITHLYIRERPDSAKDLIIDALKGM